MHIIIRMGGQLEVCVVVCGMILDLFTNTTKKDEQQLTIHNSCSAALTGRMSSEDARQGAVYYVNV